MRQIKFRAWSVDVDQFYFFDLTEQGYNIAHISKELDVEQYTGLKDKNGEEIYEGDIVTTNYPTVKNMADAWVVEFGHTGMYQMAVGSFKQSIHELVYNDWKLEVIGNIHENPELMEVVK